MINARLNEIMQDDDELFNRVKAYGPGDGINRVSVVVEDATSISTYGLRETTETFLDATSRADLTTKANDFLDAKKNPVSRGGVTLFMEEGNEVDIARGDTIRLASKELGLNTTTIVQELDWEPGQVNLTVGRDNYNLLEVINGPREDAERERAALGLPTPIGFSAQRISPGIRVFINPYANSRAVGVEIYAGPTAGFEPDQSYLLVRGASTTYDFTNLTPGDVYYFKARSYDSQGGYSDVAGPVSAIAGFVPGSRVEGGTLDLSKFVSDTRPIKIVTSLPVVVSADDPDYKVGMLVNYFTLGVAPHPYGALYRLISTTGVPSTDWVKAIDTDSIMDDAITADQILANTITANEINVGSISTAILISDAIKSNMIDAEQIDASHIQAGAITISRLANPDYDNLIVNSTMEAGISPWYLSDLVSTGGAITQDNAYSRSGSFSLRVDRETQTNSEIRVVSHQQNTVGLPVKQGDQLYLEAWVTRGNTLYTGGTTSGAEARLAIVYRNSAGSFITASYGNWTAVSLAPNFNLLSLKGTVPSGVVRADFEVRIRGKSTSNDSRYVYIDDVSARRVVKSALLTVDGEVEVTNSTQSDGAFSVKDASDEEVLRLGNIDGKSGVPLSIDYGLWGTAGTGVFISGYGHLVGSVSWTTGTWSFPSGGAGTAVSLSNTSSEFTLPYPVSSTAFIALAIAGIKSPGSVPPSGWAMRSWVVNAEAWDSASSIWRVFPVSGITTAAAGNFTKVRVTLVQGFIAITTVSASSPSRNYVPCSVIINNPS